MQKSIILQGGISCKVCIQTKWPFRLEHICSMKPQGIFRLHTWIQHCWYSFVHLGGERHCESTCKVPRPITQQGWSLESSTLSVSSHEATTQKEEFKRVWEKLEKVLNISWSQCSQGGDSHVTLIELIFLSYFCLLGTLLPVSYTFESSIPLLC